MKSLTEEVGVQADSLIKNSLLEAKKLNDAKWIYALYGALDGLSTSFSMLKYGFKITYNSSGSSSSDVLRNWSLTPLGIAIIAIESATLIGCSVIGNTMDDDGYYLHLMSVDAAKKLNHVNCYVWDESLLFYISPQGVEVLLNKEGESINRRLIEKVKSQASKTARSLHLSIKQADSLFTPRGASFSRASPTPTLTGSIAGYWSYIRDALKAMKNTDTAIRNTFVMTDLLVVGRHYHTLATPFGLILGVFAACNRIWLRKIRDERKDAKKLNTELLGHLIKSLPSRVAAKDLNEWDAFYDNMLKQHEKTREKIKPPSHSQFFWLYAQLSGAFSGLIDSPYLYFGALSLTMAAPTSFFFIFVATTSFIFAVTCIATRIFEEQNYQRELLASQLEVELAMAVKETQFLRQNLRVLEEAISVSDLTEEQRDSLGIKKSDLEAAMNASWAKSQEIHREFMHQSVLSFGFIFMSGLKNGLDTYGALASLMFLIATINLAILVPYSPLIVLCFVSMGVAGLMVFPAIALINHYFAQHQHQNELEHVPVPQDKKSTLDYFLELEGEFGETTPKRVSLHQPAVYEGALELARGACSGGGKGIRAVEQILSSFQELGADGHYHDTDSMYIFAWINAVLFAVTFGLRGFARLGRGVTVPEESKQDTPDDNSVKAEVASTVFFLPEPILMDNSVNKEVEEVEKASQTEEASTVRVLPEAILKPSDSSDHLEETKRPDPSPCTVNLNWSTGSIAPLGFFKLKSSIPDAESIHDDELPSSGDRNMDASMRPRPLLDPQSNSNSDSDSDITQDSRPDF